jgi:hypothetical protein
VIETAAHHRPPAEWAKFLQPGRAQPQRHLRVHARATGQRTPRRHALDAHHVALRRARYWANYTLDGITNTDVDFNTYIVLPSVDALQEFKVQSGIYPAEFGREAGQVNVSTKPGGNAYHGAVFEFLRNNKLDAARTISSPAPVAQPIHRRGAHPTGRTNTGSR